MFETIISHEKIISGDALEKEYRERKKDFIVLEDPKQGYEETAIPPALASEGWGIHGHSHKSIKNSDPPRYKLRKKKYLSEIFENKVWQLFYEMGCQYLNKGNFNLEFDLKGKTLKQQIDIIAIRDNYIFIVEATQRKHKNASYPDGWVTKSEAWSTNAKEIKEYLKIKYPDCIPYFFFATKGLSKKYLRAKTKGKDYEQDLADRGIVPLRDEAELQYFFGTETSPGLLKTHKDIAFHQFLSMPRMLDKNLKKNALNTDFEVRNLDITTQIGWKDNVKLKKKKVYSFYLSPKQALPLVTVPHNISQSLSDSNFFQRFIKTQRLKKINEYTRGGNQFINNIIATFNEDIKDKNKVLQGLPGLISIIDGQHRVLSYAFAEDNIKENHKLLFTVFEKGTLSDEEQVRLFIDINKKQEAVSNNLTSELELKATKSRDPEDQVSADAMRIVQSLKARAPFEERIMDSEERSSGIKVLSITQIKEGIEKAQLYSKVNSDGTNTDDGSLKFLQSSKAMRYVSDFLSLYFEDLIFQNPAAWAVGGLYGKNINVRGFLLFLKDVLDHQATIFKKTSSAKDGYDSIEPTLKHIKNWIKSTPWEKQREKAEVRYGGSGPDDFRKILGYITWTKNKSFRPEPDEDTKAQFREKDEDIMMRYKDFELNLKESFHIIMSHFYPHKEEDTHYWSDEIKTKHSTIFDRCEENIDNKIKNNYDIQKNDPENWTKILELMQIKTIVESERFPEAKDKLNEFFLVPLTNKNNKVSIDKSRSLKGKKGKEFGLKYFEKLKETIRGDDAHTHRFAIPETVRELFDVLDEEFKERTEQLRNSF